MQPHLRQFALDADACRRHALVAEDAGDFRVAVELPDRVVTE